MQVCIVEGSINKSYTKRCVLIKEFWCYDTKEEKRLAFAGSWTQDTSGLSCQCSATEPREPMSTGIYWTIGISVKTHIDTTLLTILYMYCTGGTEMPQLHTWQLLSMCRQNSVRGAARCATAWGIQSHLCSKYRGLWGLVVVQLLWLSGRALAAQARAVLGSTWSQQLPAFSLSAS